MIISHKEAPGVISDRGVSWTNIPAIMMVILKNYNSLNELFKSYHANIVSAMTLFGVEG